MGTWNLYDLIAVARDFAETAPDAQRSTIGQSGARYYAARDADSEQLTRAAGLAYDEPAVQAVLRRWATEAAVEETTPEGQMVRVDASNALAYYLRARDRLVDAYRAGRAPSYPARRQDLDYRRALRVINRPEGAHPSERRWAARRLARLELTRTERGGMNMAVALAHVAGV